MWAARIAFNGVPVIRQQSYRVSCFALQTSRSFTIQAVRSKIINPPAIMRKNTRVYDTLVRHATSSAQVKSSTTTLWIAERAVSIALIGLVPLAIMCPSKPLDVILAITAVAHTYWGFEAIISEYVRVLLFGPIVPKVTHGVLVALMVTTLGGLFYLIFNDIGLAETIRRFWSVKSKA